MPTIKNKKIKLIQLGVISLFLFLAPALSILADSVTTLEQPLPGMPGTVSSPAEYIKYFYLFGLGVVGITAATALAYGGFTYLVSAGNESIKTHAKSVMWSAVGGLLLLLGAYLILYTINSDLLNLKNPTLDVIANPPGSIEGPPAGYIPGPGGTADDVATRNELNTAGINIVSSGNCSDPNTQGCTSVGKLNPATIAGAKKLKADCDCNLTITGGTETGHSEVGGTGALSHINGYKLDYSLDSGLTNYITSLGPSVGVRKDGATLYKDTANGVLYAKEENHWDVTYF